MAYHPINLAVRFCLELVMLVAFGLWGWHLGHPIGLRLVLAVGFPLLAAILWGVFAVSGDRSRSGKAPILVPGSMRLMLEILLFGGAIWAFAISGLQVEAVCFGLAASLHYLCSYERMAWLLRS